MTHDRRVVVRRAVPDDAPALHEVSLRAIRTSAAAHYSDAQLAAWAARRSVEGHAAMIRDTTVFAAVDGDAVVGFASIALHPVGALLAGEVDQLFVHPDAGGRGVARLLLEAVESAARDAGLDELVTHASWRAAPVFEGLGYSQVEVETVQVDGETLTRARMRKLVQHDEGPPSAGPASA